MRKEAEAKKTSLVFRRPEVMPTEADVKKALIGFRQALRDLGVMNDK